MGKAAVSIIVVFGGEAELRRLLTVESPYGIINELQIWAMILIGQGPGPLRGFSISEMKRAVGYLNIWCYIATSRALVESL